MLNKYKTEKISINSDQIFKETLTIPHESEEHIISDYFIDYEDSDTNPNVKIKYNDKKEIVSFYLVTTSKQYINVLSVDSFELKGEKDNKKEDYNTEKNMQKFLEKNKINNDIDLLNYIKNHYYISNNIFTSTKTMRNNFILNTFVQITLPEFESITLLNGEVEGYIINLKNGIREIHILNKDEQHIITLSGKSPIDCKKIACVLFLGKPSMT